jgi:murein L,D-transpeptidase YafK
MRIQLLTMVLALCLVGKAQTELTKDPRVDRVLVNKKERTMELLSGEKVIKAYKVALGGDPVGPKAKQGDHRTPEGRYVLDSRNSRSRFYKSIHISYPSARDREQARKKGVSAGG